MRHWIWLWLVLIGVAAGVWFGMEPAVPPPAVSEPAAVRAQSEPGRSARLPEREPRMAMRGYVFGPQASPFAATNTAPQWSTDAAAPTLPPVATGRPYTQSMDSASAPQENEARQAANARTAELRWEGPQTVQEGRPFQVALKVTSVEPLRASPLQLSYDARYLKPLSVRAGAYFSDDNVDYRVSPNGSILVGPKGAGGVASDAEFFVVTFLPIAPGGPAELNIAAGYLRGDGGRTIAYQHPAPFRTTVQ